MTLVGHISGGKTLPEALLDQIVERADGVPLFVEELTKAVLESEQLDQPANQVAIPASLQDSLMARVDRLGSAREVLQIGGAIGREFTYDQIAAVAGLPDAVLQDALTRLTEAELLFARARRPMPLTPSSTRWCRTPPIPPCCGRAARPCTAPSRRCSKNVSPTLRRKYWRSSLKALGGTTKPLRFGARPASGTYAASP